MVRTFAAGIAKRSQYRLMGALDQRCVEMAGADTTVSAKHADGRMESPAPVRLSIDDFSIKHPRKCSVSTPPQGKEALALL